MMTVLPISDHLRALWRAALSLVLVLIAAVDMSRGADKGLDVVMLVDVSASMSPLAQTPGNDPQRLRWDAVKLVLDLLCEEDRLLVLPFNHDCPAIKDSKQFVPGRLPSQLQFVDSRGGAARKEMAARIESFIHEQNPAPTSDATELNGDAGGTGILKALGIAADRLDSARGAQRRAVVILLTDGGQDDGNAGVDTPDDHLVHDAGQKWKQDFRVAYFGRAEIPVHTLGLGLGSKQENAARFLDDLASLTKGSATQVQSNQQLVESFRTLIWSLRDCWISPLALKGTAIATSGPLDGVIDMGVLCYEERRPAIAGRQLFAPDPALQLDWKGSPAGIQSLMPAPRTGKSWRDSTSIQPKPTGYAFYYFDGRIKPADDRSELYRKLTGLELQLSLGDGAADREVKGYFVKRLPVRFEVRLARNRFYRHEPIPLEVAMIGATGSFRAEDFIVQATLSTNVDNSRKTIIALQPGENVFRVPADKPLSAAELQASTSLIDVAKLEISVQEKSKQGYEHQLPPRTIEVENVLLLEQPSEELLAQSPGPPGKIQIQAAYSVAGEFPVRLVRKYPRHEDQKIPLLKADNFDLRAIPAPAKDQPDNLLLKDGRLVIGARLVPADGQLPAVGRYEKGTLRLTSRDPQGIRIAMRGFRYPDPSDAFYFEVPFRLRVGTVGLHLNSEKALVLVVGPKRPIAVNDCSVGLVSKDALPAGTGSVSVQLVEAGKSDVQFSEEELWIQPKGDGPVESTRRARSLQLKELGEPLQVHFQPDPLKHPEQQHQLIGDHHFILRAGGAGFDTAEREVTLSVEPPQVEIDKQPGAVILHQSPGGDAHFAYRARMHWLPSGSLPFEVRPQGTVKIRDEEATDVIRASYDLPFEGPRGPLQLIDATATKTADLGWTDLEFKVQVPARTEAGEPLRLGSYAGAFNLVFRPDEPAVASLPLRLRLDGLYAMYPLIQSAQKVLFEREGAVLPKAARASRVDLVQFFDAASTAVVTVRGELKGTKLTASNLTVMAGKPDADGTLVPYLINAQDPRDYVAAPICRVRAGAAEDAVEVEIQLPRVSNAFPNVPYRGELTFSYDDPGQRIRIGATRLELTVTFVEPGEVLSLTPVAKKAK